MRNERGAYCKCDVFASWVTNAFPNVRYCISITVIYTVYRKRDEGTEEARERERGTI